jgi:hypothetical protein
MRAYRRYAVAASVLVSALLVFSGLGSATELLPRRPFDPEPLVISDRFDHQLVVKFRDGVQARAREDGAVESLTGRDLAEVHTVAHELGLSFSPLIDLSEEKLRGLEDRAAARSGREQPDLAGMLVAAGPSSDSARLLAAGEALQALPEVEWVSLEAVGVPPPFDIPPTTPDVSDEQGYLLGNPGANPEFVWPRGTKGQGVRLSDCEYGWNPDHEDLNEIDLHLEPGQVIHPDVYTNGWHEHGTAVIGETSSMHNEYGCLGMAPDAPVFTYPEWTLGGGFRRTACITNAIANSSVGDVVLLEMQALGAGGGFGPAELDLSVWTAVQTGSAAGVIVVGAAGNGNQDLDSAPYEPYMNRGDSGAIIVGAGSSNIWHMKLSFSTYGSRVNVHGWGENVFTLGYGDIAYGGSDPNQYYTDTFGGTSSASPMVASACVLIQSFQLLVDGTPLSPATMRQLLIDTGWPQGGGGGHIGPMVNIKKALKTQYPGLSAPLPESRADGAMISHHSYPNPFVRNASIRFDLGREESLELTIHDLAGRRVRRLLDGEIFPAGTHSVLWDGRDRSGARVPAGVYFYRLESDRFRVSDRMIRMR